MESTPNAWHTPVQHLCVTHGKGVVDGLVESRGKRAKARKVSCLLREGQNVCKSNGGGVRRAGSWNRYDRLCLRSVEEGMRTAANSFEKFMTKGVLGFDVGRPRGPKRPSCGQQPVLRNYFCRNQT